MLGASPHLLRRPGFGQYVASISADALASWATQVLLITLIGLTKPGRIIAYSGGALLIGLPPLLLAPLAGVLIDRTSRRNALFGSELAKSLLLGLIPIAYLTTHSLLLVWLLIFLVFVADTFKNSSAPALLPELVQTGQLVQANSVSAIGHRAATLIGMFVTGYVIAAIGWQASSLAIGLVQAGAACLLLGVRVPVTRALPDPSPDQPIHDRAGPDLSDQLRSFVQDLSAVLVQIRRNRYVAFVVLSIVICYSISAVAYTALLFLLQQVLGLDSRGVSIYLGLLAVGMLLGAALAGIVGDRLRPTRAIILGSTLIGMLLLVGPWLIQLWFLALVALTAGIAFAWIRIAQPVILQRQIAPELQGRIFATREFLANLVFIAVTATIGLVSLITMLNTVLVLIGVALVGLSVTGWLMLSGRTEV
ncbi:MAG: MFS transporter [candidate division WOR-3 bacterium]